MLKTTSNMVANLQNKTLYICRHGKTVWNTEGKIQGTLNSPLTSEGISQAKNVSDALIDVDFDVFLHSPSMRVLETLSYMSINGRIECDEHLNEIDHGVYEGKYVCDIDSDWYATRKHDVWSTRWIDGESYKDVFERIQYTLKSINDVDGNTIGVLAHEGVNRILVYALGLITHDELHTFKQANHEIIKVEKGKLTIIEV